MTDATERRLAGLLAQISEMIDNRLPQEGIKQNGFAMWQFWVVIGTMLFYSGALWWQINTNSEAVSVNAKHIAENGESMVQHIQWELEHEIAIKNAEIKKLRSAR